MLFWDFFIYIFSPWMTKFSYEYNPQLCSPLKPTTALIWHFDEYRPTHIRRWKKFSIFLTGISTPPMRYPRHGALFLTWFPQKAYSTHPNLPKPPNRNPPQSFGCKGCGKFEQTFLYLLVYLCSPYTILPGLCRRITLYRRKMPRCPLCQPPRFPIFARICVPPLYNPTRLVQTDNFV